MTIELTLLTWTVVLGLFHIVIATVFKRTQDGLKWAGSSRDKPRNPYTGVTGRLDRAEKNFFETMPLFAVAVLLAHLAGRENSTTAMGAEIYFWCRVAYIPLYASGVSIIRTIVWGASMVGLVMVVLPLLAG